MTKNEPYFMVLSFGFRFLKGLCGVNTADVGCSLTRLFITSETTEDGQKNKAKRHQIPLAFSLRSATIMLSLQKGTIFVLGE